MDQLNDWGPKGSDCSSPQDAIQYCRDLAVRHAENFSVLSRFVPDRLVDGIAALYAFTSSFDAPSGGGCIAIFLLLLLMPCRRAQGARK